MILCIQSAFLPFDRKLLVIYLIFKLLEIRQRLGECHLSWCWVVSVCICNITQLLPLTQSITWNMVFCFSKISNGTLYLWLSVDILCSGGFFHCHSMLSQVPFLYVLWRCFCIWCNTVTCIYFWSRKCWFFSRAFCF